MSESDWAEIYNGTHTVGGWLGGLVGWAEWVGGWLGEQGHVCAVVVGEWVGGWLGQGGSCDENALPGR